MYSKQFTIEEIDPQKQYTLMIRARSTAVNDSTPFYIKWVSLKDITQSPSTEVTVKIASPENGDIFEPCQDITLVADIQTTEPDIVEKIRFYNNGKLIKFDTYFPWEFTIENIKSGVYNVTTQAYLKDGRKITSEVVKFFVVEDCIAAGECLYNQSFNCESIDPWYLDLQWFGGGEATVRFLSGDAHFDGGDYIMIDIEKVGHGVWSVQLWQKINYILGHTYKFSILLDADDQKQVQLEAGDGWSDGVQFTKAYNIEDVTLLTGEFTVNHVGQENFFSIGVGTNTRPLYIKQVSLIDTAAPDSMFYLIDPGTDIEYRAPNAVENYKLFQAYPNPFNPTTTIKYNLQWPGNVKLTVYNALGKEVVELVNDFQVEGSHSVLFDAQHLPTGIYLYQLQIDGEYSEMKKMVFLK